MPVPAVPATYTVGQKLTAASLNSIVTDLTYGFNGKPLAILTQTVAQSIPASAWTAITLDSTTLDRDGGHSNSTNNSRYTCQTAGYYTIFALGSFATSVTTGRRLIGIRQNNTGTAAPSAVRNDSVWVGNPQSISCSCLIYLAVGDWVEVLLYQDTGGAVNTDVTDLQTRGRMNLIFESQ